MVWKNIKRFSGKIFRQPVYAAKVAKKRAEAYFSYYVRHGKAGYPEALTLFLTHRCNLRCKMCGQWGDSGVTKHKSGNNITADMSIEELKKVIDDVLSSRPNITLFGGEPLLHRHAMELIGYIKKRGLHCLMITNGSMLDKKADNLVDSRLDELNVSIDGGRELHDRIRGMPGLFDRIMSGLQHVTRLKIKKNLKKPLINLQCTINKDNYHHLEQMIDVAEKTGADSLTFHNLIFVSRDMLKKQGEYDTLLQCSSANWEGFHFEPSIDPDLLYSKMKDIISTPHRFAIIIHMLFRGTVTRAV
jgi:MoaA/NifB/PqqE/SkfB family radical SAM enzyme